MSVNAPTFFVSQFASNIQLLLQQRGSKVRPYVMTGSHVGKQASPVDQVGSVAMQLVTSRFQPIGRVDALLDRRWVFPSDYDLNQLIDSFDKLKMLLDPKSSYVQNAVFAAGRTMDDLIIDAFFGTAKTGETGATSTTFPAANQVAVNFGATGNTGLTVAKLREAKRLLMSFEVDLDSDPITALVTSKQHDNLLAEAQVISTDFNERPVLVDGKVTRFLGINIVHCERLDNDTTPYRRIPVFAKSGMYLGIWEDIKTDISQRKDIQSLPWQCYVQMSAGATRLEENKVIEIKCAE
ncbi:hypothetical protein E6Q11_02590 [Candidatus Dojkabacteria bacterium]|uniref:Phage major capsid protein n=1 Tax=Candidatus Dojkabacteria bacterium TaxID=2099670 RepID=A0A5C7J857_9BACT|nr:MAG: hypothetical protein E6Q11_02590 [Candidatus Dojkabacteria bacterium]